MGDRKILDHGGGERLALKDTLLKILRTETVLIEFTAHVMYGFFFGKRLVYMFHKLREQKFPQFLIKGIYFFRLFELGDGPFNDSRICGSQKRIDGDIGHADGTLKRDRRENQIRFGKGFRKLLLVGSDIRDQDITAKTLHQFLFQGGPHIVIGGTVQYDPDMGAGCLLFL